MRNQSNCDSQRRDRRDSTNGSSECLVASELGMVKIGSKNGMTELTDYDLNQ